MSIVIENSYLKVKKTEGIHGVIAAGGSKEVFTATVFAALIGKVSVAIKYVPSVPCVEKVTDLLQKYSIVFDYNEDKKELVVDGSTFVPRESDLSLEMFEESVVLFSLALLKKNKEYRVYVGKKKSKEAILEYFEAFKKDFSAFGIDYRISGDYFLLKRKDFSTKEYTLLSKNPLISQLMLLLAISEKKTIKIHNISTASEVQDTAEALRSMGVSICYTSSQRSSLLISHKAHFQSFSHALIADRKEIEFFLLVGAAAGGVLRIINAPISSVKDCIAFLRAYGHSIEEDESAFGLTFTSAENKIGICKKKNDALCEEKILYFLLSFFVEHKGIHESVIFPSLKKKSIFFLKHLGFSVVAKNGEYIVSFCRKNVTKGSFSIMSSKEFLAVFLIGLLAKATIKISGNKYFYSCFENFDKKIASIGIETELVSSKKPSSFCYKAESQRGFSFSSPHFL
jgi:UDP-N-acetylglucosamine enolpyruvyl transferase